jgi:trigger factor
MLSRWEKIENNKIKLEIEVPAAEVETALARAYRQVVKKVNLPGFRKGKVPRRILESRFGPQLLHEEALEILVPPAYRQALEEAGHEPIDQPEFELAQEIEEGKPLLFSAVVEVLPSVELGEYRGVAVEQKAVIITEEQVDQSLQSLREQHARLVPVEDRSAQNGDLVLLDFQGFIDGETFSGGEAENYSLELGSQTFIPGFEEQLVGVSAGEEKEINARFPEDYRKAELAGKDVLFKVRVRQIKEKQLPEPDDAFAREAGEFTTLEELKADIRERMEKTARDEARVRLEEALIQKVSDTSAVELPPLLVERQIDRIIGDMEQYLRFQGLNLEKFAELSGRSIEELRKDKRPEAEKRAKANLVLDAVIKKEGITVADSEIDEKITAIAGAYNDEPGRVREILQKQGRIPLITEEIRMRKAIDLLVNEAQVKQVENGR